MSEPRVSVIMPAFNVEPYVREAVESILRQSLEDLELLVADDASTDRTRAVIDSIADHRIRLFHKDTNQGPGETRNVLLGQARGEFVAFQDADDVSLPTRLAAQVYAFNVDTGLAICGTFYENMRSDGALVRKVEKPVWDEEIRQTLSLRIPFLCSSLMIRRSVLSGMEWFRPYFNRIGCEDYDLAYRIAERQRAANLPVVLYRVRSVPGSFSRTRRDPRQAYVEELVRSLAAERAQKGSDCLMCGDREALERLEEILGKPYRDDPALEFRRAAGALLAAGEYRPALRAASRAIGVGPWNVANYRALFYTVRKVRPNFVKAAPLLRAFMRRRRGRAG